MITFISPLVVMSGILGFFRGLDLWDFSLHCTTKKVYQVMHHKSSLYLEQTRNVESWIAGEIHFINNGLAPSRVPLSCDGEAAWQANGSCSIVNDNIKKQTNKHFSVMLSITPGVYPPVTKMCAVRKASYAWYLLMGKSNWPYFYSRSNPYKYCWQHVACQISKVTETKGCWQTLTKPK